MRRLTLGGLLLGTLSGSFAQARGFGEVGLPWLPWAGLALVLGSGLMLARRKWRHTRPADAANEGELTIMVMPPTRFARKAAKIPAPARRATVAASATPAAEPVWTIELLQRLGQEDFDALCLALYREKGMRPHSSLNAEGGDIRLFSDTSTAPVAVARCCTALAGQIGAEALLAMHTLMQTETLAAGFFVALGGFSDEARTFASTHRITPIDGRLLLVMLQRLAPPVQRRLWEQARSALACAPRFCRGPVTEML